MTISDLENCFNSCVNYVQTTKNLNAEIKSYLTEFLLIRICAEYEKEIKRIIVNRTELTGDMELASFMKQKGDVRDLSTSALKGNILKPFSQKYGDLFDKMVAGTEYETRYNNIITNRNKAAHGGIVNMTFEELIQSYPLAKRIMDSMSKILTPLDLN